MTEVFIGSRVLDEIIKAAVYRLLLWNICRRVTKEKGQCIRFELNWLVAKSRGPEFPPAILPTRVLKIETLIIYCIFHRFAEKWGTVALHWGTYDRVQRAIHRNKVQRNGRSTTQARHDSRQQQEQVQEAKDASNWKNQRKAVTKTAPATIANTRGRQQR